MEEKLKEIFGDILGKDIPVEGMSTENTEKWDSLSHLNLMTAIEEEFDVEIPADDFPGLYKDYATVREYLHEKAKTD